MLKNYLKVALKVLGRRKFFTFISLFGISVTLLVLLVATALLDNVFAAAAPEVHADRMLGVYRMTMKGPENTWTSPAGYAFLDRYVRPMAKLPSVERITITTFAESGRLLPERPQDPVLDAPRGRRILAGARVRLRGRGAVHHRGRRERPPGRGDQRDDAASASSTAGRRWERRWRRTARVSGWWAWCGTCRSSATPRRPISGCRSRPPSRARYKEEWLRRFRGPDPRPQPCRPAADQGGVPVHPARGREADPRSQDLQDSHRRGRHAVRRGGPALPPRPAGRGARRSSCGRRCWR